MNHPNIILAASLQPPQQRRVNTPGDLQTGTKQHQKKTHHPFAFLLLLALHWQGNWALRYIKTTYFITPTYNINQSLQALNVCDSITNQQIDTSLFWCWYLVFSIMQQHLSAEAKFICFPALWPHLLCTQTSPVSQQELGLSLEVCKKISLSCQRHQGQL